MFIPIILTSLLAGALLIIYRWYERHYHFWRSQNVPYIPSSSLFGNITDIVFNRQSVAEVLQEFYNHEKTKDEPVVGIQLFHQPALVIRDPEIIKRVLVKDFNYFANRFSSSDPHSDTIGSYNLFFLRTPLWKQVRTHLTPIFTSGKMKQFFHLVNDIGKNLDNHLRKLPLDSNVSYDVKELSALYTTDVIASVAYGIEANSFKNPDSDFRKNGRNIFTFTPWRAFEFLTFAFLPQLVSTFRCKVFSQESTSFIRSTFNYIVSERVKRKQTRTDLIDLLIKIRDTTQLEVDDKMIKFDGDILVSQAAIFFTAGFETTSATMSFGLYELSKQPEIQKRLRNEIREVLKANNGEITYDIILNMIYLNMVVQEILRLYPPLPYLDRQCSPPAGEGKGYSLDPIVDFEIPDKMAVLIPVYAIQRNEKYFPDPEKFDPERFSAENKGSIIPYTYMPFGTGGRNCIGERFGIMQAKIGLFNFLKNHYVKMSPRMPENMKLEKKALIIQSEGGIYCDIIRDQLAD